jgi:hypothetical protein
MNLFSCTIFGIKCFIVTHKIDVETTNEMHLVGLMHGWVDQFVTKSKSPFTQKSG